MSRRESLGRMMGGSVDICCYVVLFGIASVIGWVVECAFHAVREKKWVNRGFLFGPVCPIYGVGLVAGLVLFSVSPALDGGSALPWWQVFAECALGSAVLEYVSSYVLERCFHARWWDYSNQRFNLNGRVCLRFALCFGAAGTGVYYLLMRPIQGLSASVPLVAWEVGALVVVALLAADTALTVEALADLTKRIEDSQANFDAVMEVAVNDMSSGRLPLQDDLAASTSRLAGELSGLQRRALRTVITFTTEKRDAAAARLREAAEQASAQAGKLVDGVRKR